MMSCDSCLGEGKRGRDGFFFSAPVCAHCGGTGKALAPLALPPSLANVAGGKRAYMSSEYVAKGAGKPEHGGRRPAENAVDGDNGDDDDGSSDVHHIAHSQSDKQAWWEVDLGAPHEIRCIFVYTRTHQMKRLFPSCLLVSDEPLPIEAGSLEEARTIASREAPLASVGRCAEVWFVPGCRGRYVRVQLETKNYLQLAQVEVYGSLAVGPRDLAPKPLVICTYNVRGLEDEWPMRKPALTQLFNSIGAHVLNLQESIAEQWEWFRDAVHGGSREGQCHLGLDDLQMVVRPPDGWWVLERAACIAKFKTGFKYRGALTQVLVAPDGRRVLVVNTHMDWRADHPEGRLSQTQEILALIGSMGVECSIVTGDLNGVPEEPFYEAFRNAGYRSAVKEHTGHELPTYKSGSDHTDTGDVREKVLDYIWYKGLDLAEVNHVGVEPVSPDRPNLFPSDHIGLCASFQLPKA